MTAFLILIMGQPRLCMQAHCSHASELLQMWQRPLLWYFPQKGSVSVRLEVDFCFLGQWKPRGC
jgi:hypothetical protein